MPGGSPRTDGGRERGQPGNSHQETKATPARPTPDARSAPDAELGGAADPALPYRTLRRGFFSPKSTAESRRVLRTDPESSEPPHGEYSKNLTLPEPKCLRPHKTSGLNFPEFTRPAFLSGRARDGTGRLDYTSQNSEGKRLRTGSRCRKKC